MGQFEILRTARSLGTFTIAELAEEASANENTVRNLITTRASEFFTAIDSEATTGRGRAPSRYSVSDEEGLDQRIAVLVSTALGDSYAEELDRGRLPRGLGFAGPKERIEITRIWELAKRLDWAESQLIRATTMAHDVDRTRVLQMAVRSAESILDSQPAQNAPDLIARAEAVPLCSALLQALPISAELGEVATKLATVQGGGTPIIRPLLSALVAYCQTLGEAPPIGVVSSRRSRPKRVLDKFGKTSTWRSCTIGGLEHTALWYPEWATALLPGRMLVGFVLDARWDAPADLDRAARCVQTWNVPTIAIGQPREETLRYLALGVTPLPELDESDSGTIAFEQATASFFRQALGPGSPSRRGEAFQAGDGDMMRIKLGNSRVVANYGPDDSTAAVTRGPVRATPARSRGAIGA